MKTMSFPGSKVWQELSQDIKSYFSLNLLKSIIKRHGTLAYLCKIHKLLSLMWVKLIKLVINQSCYYLQNNATS